MRKKSVLSLVLMLITVTIFLGYPVFADEDDMLETGDEIVVDGLVYELQENNEVILTDYQSEALTSLTIPGTITYNQQTYIVASIEEHTFSGCDTLTSITMEENITGIGEYAFSECDSLQQITFPSTLKDLGRGIFSGSDNVTITVASGNNIVHYEDGMLTKDDILYYVSPALEEVALPSKVHTIAAYAFQNCDYLESIVIPETIREIEEYAFFQCYGMHSITMENNPNISIERNAFADMEETGTIYVPAQEMKQHIEANSQCYPSGVQVTLIIPYQITYHVDGGTFKETCVTQTDNTKAVLLPEVEKQGYEFLGWCRDEACQQEPIYQLEEGQSGNVVLYAKWEAQAEQEQEEEELSEEEAESLNRISKLLQPEKSRYAMKKKNNKTASANVTVKPQLEAVPSLLQKEAMIDETVRRQETEPNDETVNQRTDIRKETEDEEQTKHQTTGGKSVTNSLTAKLLLAIGFILILAGGGYELSRYTSKRKETHTNEKSHNSNHKEEEL